MIHIKSDDEIAIMRQGGRILAYVLDTLVEKTAVGVKLIELDKLAEDLIIKKGAKPSFKMVKGYKWTICVCLNDMVVHGVPTDYSLKKTDEIGVDCGVYYQGFHTDSARSVYLGEDTRIKNFLQVGSIALKEAIAQVKPDNYIYDISKSIQDTVERAGFSVVRNLVGHGIGKSLHEEPSIPCFASGNRKESIKLQEGMVLAIEVIYNMGKKDVELKSYDGWTILTKDGKISGLFEATVAVTSRGCIVLT